MDIGRLDASVYPAVQNFCLAARSLGLGTALTTVIRIHGAEVLAELGVPDGRFEIARSCPSGGRSAASAWRREAGRRRHPLGRLGRPPLSGDLTSGIDRRGGGSSGAPPVLADQQPTIAAPPADAIHLLRPSRCGLRRVTEGSGPGKLRRSSGQPLRSPGAIMPDGHGRRHRGNPVRRRRPVASPPVTDLSSEAVADAARYFDRWLAFRQRYERVPGVQAAVLHDDAVVLSCAHGLADVEAGDAATARPPVPHRLALEDVHGDGGDAARRARASSPRRSRRRLARLPRRLAARGRDDPRAPRPRRGGRPRRLGRRLLAALPSRSPTARSSPADQSRRGRVLPRNERFKYSNIGYSLLGLVIEEATAQPVRRVRRGVDPRPARPRRHRSRARPVAARRLRHRLQRV